MAGRWGFLWGGLALVAGLWLEREWVLGWSFWWGWLLVLGLSWGLVRFGRKWLAKTAGWIELVLLMLLVVVLFGGRLALEKESWLALPPEKTLGLAKPFFEGTADLRQCFLKNEQQLTCRFENLKGTIKEAGVKPLAPAVSESSPSAVQSLPKSWECVVALADWDLLASRPGGFWRVKGQLQSYSLIGERGGYFLKEGLAGKLAGCEVDWQPRVLTAEPVEALREAKRIFQTAPIYWRLRFALNLGRYLTGDRLALARAFLLGERGTFSQSLAELFARVGLAHVVAISGSHLVILGELVFYLLGGGRRGWTLLIWLMALTGFVILIGCPPSALRALIMTALTVYGGWRGYLVRAGRLSGLIFAGLVLINPWWFFYDKGFWLSFTAIWGLIFLADPLERWLKRSWRWLPAIGRKLFSATTSAQLATMPLTVYWWGNWSWRAWPANLTATWIAGPLLSLLSLTLFLDSWDLKLARLVAVLAGYGLDYLLAVAHFWDQI